MDKRITSSVFESVVDRYPESIAVEAPDGELTYTELDCAANAIANCLMAWEFTAGTVVAVFIPNSAAYISSVLGVQKAGGVFMPTDPNAPHDRQARMFAKAEPGVVIVDEERVPVYWQFAEQSGFKPRLLMVAGPKGPVRLYPSGGTDQVDVVPDYSRPEVLPDPDDDLYIIFTSGTTGNPKAVLGRQKGLAHFLNWERTEFGLDGTVRASNLAPTTFDVSLRDIFVPLTAGGTVSVPRENIVSSPGALIEWLSERKVNLIHIVPSVFRLLLDELEKRPEPQNLISHIKHIMLAGEAVYGRDVLRFRETTGNSVHLVNLYGPSETTLAKLFCRLDFLPENPARIMPLGHPISNTAVIILKGNRLAEIGEIGEICIKTPFRTKGYFREPELTAKAFVTDPLTDDPDDIIYRTGDMGRYMSDRSVEFAGRIDRQVKVNGVRVELSEVDVAVSSYDGISQALVMPHNRDDGETSLICYYTEKSPVNIEKLREFLSKSLYSAMIPTFYVRLDSFPLGITGKINRRALPKPEAIIYENHDYAAPETDTEQRIAAIWSEILGIQKVSVSIPFSVLGGGSMQAIRCIGNISRAFNIEISLQEFFNATTVRKLAEVVESAQHRSRDAAIPPQPERPDYPATHSQKRLWILQSMITDFTAFNIAGCFRVYGELDEYTLECALRTVLYRHDILRTVFFERAGELRQRVIPEPSVRLERLGHVDTTHKIDTIADGFCQTVFDLEKGPLIRAGVLSYRDMKLIMFVIHHIICDAWSLDILLSETMTIYRGIRDGVPSPLPQPALQYRDFAAWQNSQLTTDELEKQRQYWLEHLKGDLPRLELPLDAPRPSRRNYFGATLSYTFHDELFASLRDYASKQGYTIFPILLAGLRALLFRYTGQSEIILNSPMTLRGRPELEKLPGDFTNTVLLRGTVYDDTTFTVLADDSANEIDRAMANREYPFDLLAAELNVQNDLSRAPVSDVGVTLVEDYDDSLPINQDLRFEPFEVDAGISKYDMVFHFSLSSSGLSLAVEYDSVILLEKRVRRMAANLSTLLAHALSQPDTAISKLDIIDPAEKSIIERFQHPRQRNYPDSTIHGEFERITSEQPDSCALVLEGSSLMTFSELDNAANRIAAMLSANGYANGDRIAVHMQRGPDVPAVILGILKAGCIYVPIADDCPPPRIKYMLKDCNAKAAIVTADLAINIPKAIRCHNVNEAQRYPDTALSLDINPGSGAYIIYTSGSTGSPKGVLLPHIGLVNRARDLKERISITSRDRFTQFASLSFDASLYETFCALLSGASLVVVDRETIEDTGSFLELLDKEEVTFTLLPPTYLRRLGRVKLQGVRVLFTAGEAADAGDTFHYARELTYLNGYGPTEDSVCSSVFIVDPAKEYPLGIPIGDPVGDTEAMVLDRNLRQVPIGVPGQLCVSDQGLALGYINLPELTSEVFVSHPFEPEKRMYLTGDIARWDEDGNLVFLGRIDNQVKIDGHRIELGEIESVIRVMDGVGDACVVTVGESGDMRLAAFFTGSTDGNSVRASLLKTLPRYMVPHFFTKMDSLPLTVSGKIDRKALPNLMTQKESGTRKAVTEEEIALINIICEVLDNQTLSIDENFFSAGGDSIRAIQVASRLRERGWLLSAGNFFETPVISDLARSLRPIQPSIPQKPVSGPVKTTPILEWFKHTVTAKPEHFNQAVMLKSEDEVDFPSLQLALSAVWKHHDALRMVVIDDTFSILSDETLIEAEFVDLRDDPNPEVAMLDTAKQVQSGFQLKTGPLFRVLLFRRKDGYRLLLIAHHLVVDAFSWRIIAQDLEDAYEMARNGEDIHLPAKTHSLPYWSEALHNRLESGDFDGELSYWQNVVNTECDTLVPHAQEDMMVTVTSTMKGKEVSGILEEGVSHEPLARMLAGLACALREWKSNNRVRVLLEGHGRNFDESGIDITRTVGWFTTEWPFILECVSDVQVAFTTIQAKLSEVPNGGLGYGLLRYLGGHDELETSMDISFNYLGRLEDAEGAFSFTNEAVGETVSPENRLGQVLEFVLIAVGNTLEINLTYDSGHLSNTEVEHLLELFIERLKRTAECRLTAFDYNDFGDGGIDDFLENI